MKLGSIWKIGLAAGLFSTVIISGCRHAGDSSNGDLLAARSGKSDLAGKSYCREVGSLGGGRSETCLNFKANGVGEENDVSGGVPRNDAFYYYVKGKKVTIVVSDSPTVSRTRELTLAPDGSTLELLEDGSMFTWVLKTTSSDILANKSYCRMIGSIGRGGQVETCMNFNGNGVGVENDVSGGVPRASKFSYQISGKKVTIVYSDSPTVSRQAELTLASDGSTLTMMEGTSMFVWSVKSNSKDALTNTSYCRMVGSLNGGRQVETCMHFKENGQGENDDVSSGIPQRDPFTYSIAGSRVTITISKSPLHTYVGEYQLSRDKQTLSKEEGRQTFEWKRR